MDVMKLESHIFEWTKEKGDKVLFGTLLVKELQLTMLA